MLKILFLSLILLFSPLIALAQQPSRPSARPDATEQIEKKMHQEREKMQQERERMKQEMKQWQEEELERLKKINPEFYEERKNALDRQEKISSIVSAFRQGKLSASQAESQLFPLLKQDMQSSIEGLDNRIKRLEEKLVSLKQAKNNPDLLVKNRIDGLLGRTRPKPEEFVE